MYWEILVIHIEGKRLETDEERRIRKEKEKNRDRKDGKRSETEEERRIRKEKERKDRDKSEKKGWVLQQYLLNFVQAQAESFTGQLTLSFSLSPYYYSNSCLFGLKFAFKLV